MSFDLVMPRSLGEALALLDPDDPEVRPLGGGTALMLMLKSGLWRPRRLVSLRALGGELGRIEADAAGGLRVGAMVRLVDLERSPQVRRAAPVIAAILPRHSNVRVRNVATVGGNLAHSTVIRGPDLRVSKMAGSSPAHDDVHPVIPGLDPGIQRRLS